MIKITDQQHWALKCTTYSKTDFEYKLPVIVLFRPNCFCGKLFFKKKNRNGGVVCCVQKMDSVVCVCMVT